MAILKAGGLPVIKLLAYNLEKTPRREVYSTVERALQDAFGIQVVCPQSPSDSLGQHPSSTSSYWTRGDGFPKNR